MPSFDNLTAMELLILKFKNRGAIMFVLSIFMMVIIRNVMFKNIEKKLNNFFERTMVNYKNNNTEDRATEISTPNLDGDDDGYKASSDQN